MRISALALLKMAMHAKSGANIEVMGVMQGKVLGDTFIVIDAFALPVEGTETRVNAAAEGYEYMVDFLETSKVSGRMENIVGWYHSHPGYGCWLSGIDVSTQMTNQRYQEPFLAIVVDPHRTLAAGKVELGAFRTYPEGYSPPDEGPSQYQTIPLDKIEDFGVHSKQYYPLEVSYFKSATDAALLDALWGKYWAATLSSSPLLATRDLVTGQIGDVARKLGAVVDGASSGKLGPARFMLPVDRKKGGKWEGCWRAGGAFSPFRFFTHCVGRNEGWGHNSWNNSQHKCLIALHCVLMPLFFLLKTCAEENTMKQATHDGANVATELLKGLATQVTKELLFNRRKSGCGHGTAAPEILENGKAHGEPMEM